MKTRVQMRLKAPAPPIAKCQRGWCFLLSLSLFVCLLLPSQVWASPSKTDTQKANESAQEPALPLRNVQLIPLEQWHNIVKKNKNGVIMPYGALLRLWKKASKASKSRKMGGNERKALLRTMKIVGKVRQQQARLTVELKVHVFQRGWQQIPLPIRGLGLTKAQVQGAIGLISRKNGQHHLYVKGPGKVRCVLEGGVRIQTTERGRWLQMQVPSVPYSSFSLQIPGKQEVSSSYNRFQIGHKNKQTLITGGLQGKTRIKLFYRPKETTTQRKAIYSAFTENRYRLHPTLQWLESDIHFSVKLGKQKNFRVQLPKDFVLTGVQAADLAEFRVDKKTAILWFRLLRAPKSGKFTLKVRMIRNQKLQDTTLRSLRAIGAFEERGKMGLWTANLLQTRIKGLQALKRISNQRIRIWRGKRANWVFGYWHPNHKLQLSFQTIQPILEVRQKNILQLKPRQARFFANLHFHLKAGELYHTNIEIPKTWRVQDVLDSKGKSIRFWQQKGLVGITFAKKWSAGNKSKLTLRLLNRISLPQTGAMTLDYPSIRVKNAKKQTGELSVRISPFYILKNKKLSQLEPTRAKGWELKILKAPYKGQLEIQRKTPSIHQVTVGRYRVQQDILRIQTDAHFQIKGSGIRSVKLRTPKLLSEKASVTFEGVGVQIVSQKKITLPQNQK